MRSIEDRDIVVLGGARTPMGKFGGGLRDVSATELGIHAAKAALQRTGVPTSEVDHVVFGNVLQTSTDAPYLARAVGLGADLPIETPALTVNRLCGSGLEAILTGARMLERGEARFVLAGGAENMSQAPYVLRGARRGYRMGDQKLEDLLVASALTDSYNGLPMGITAENLAERYGVSREEQDRFSARSQELAHEASESGRLGEEIVPMELPGNGSGPQLVERDEHRRPDSTFERLTRLRPLFKEDGTVTAGNSSGIVDGAAAVVVTTGEEARKHGLEVLGRIVSWASVGVPPQIMGIGPAPAVRTALDRSGLNLGDMDVIEVNEAFAAQCIAVERELGIDRERLNPNGGAIALGHPLGMTGARLLLTALLELRRQEARYGLVSMCIGGGQGLACVIERVKAA